jgi:hypothetical protein
LIWKNSQTILSNKNCKVFSEFGFGIKFRFKISASFTIDTTGILSSLQKMSAGEHLKHIRLKNKTTYGENAPPRPPRPLSNLPRLAALLFFFSLLPKPFSLATYTIK